MQIENIPKIQLIRKNTLRLGEIDLTTSVIYVHVIYTDCSRPPTIRSRGQNGTFIYIY